MEKGASPATMKLGVARFATGDANAAVVSSSKISISDSIFNERRGQTTRIRRVTGLSMIRKLKGAVCLSMS